MPPALQTSCMREYSTIFLRSVTYWRRPACMFAFNAESRKYRLVSAGFHTRTPKHFQYAWEEGKMQYRGTAKMALPFCGSAQ